MKTAMQRANASTDRRRSVTVFGDIEIVYRAVTEDTDGVYSLFEITVPPVRDRRRTFTAEKTNRGTCWTASSTCRSESNPSRLPLDGSDSALATSHTGSKPLGLARLKC
jgi:hypothetical protein